MNLIYFGTSKYSKILLDYLKKHADTKIVQIVTKPNSDVEKWADENKIETVQLENLTEIPENSLGLVADFGLMIPQPIIELFKGNLINIHFSLLPKHRGAAPVAYAILNNEKQTGITFQQMVFEMDKGKIITQIPYPIAENDTTETLYTKLFHEAGKTTSQIIKDYLDGNLALAQQNENDATYTTPSGKFDRTTQIQKEDAKIDWQNSDTKIEAQIRAFYPWPIAFTTVKELAQKYKKNVRNENSENQKVKIFKAKLTGGILEILEVAPENKNKMDFKSFENGYLKD